MQGALATSTASTAVPRKPELKKGLSLHKSDFMQGTARDVLKA